jgi:DNA repair protein RecN (Recombination protein N)
MLNFLRIRNLATIEDLEVRFEEGFNILTGETGAGKSIIIDAIKLVLGEKGSPDFIRTGKKEALIDAVFEAPGFRARFGESVPGDDDSVSVQRQITDQGTGRSYLNAVLVPVKKLKELGVFLVDIYGQNDHIFLLDLGNHLDYLDSFSEATSVRSELAQAARSLKSLIRQKLDLESRRREREQRLDVLAYQLREIEGARLKEGEDAELEGSRHILKNAEKISALVERGLGLCYVEENSLAPLLSRFKNVLADLTAFFPQLRETRESIEEFEITVRELAGILVQSRDKYSAAPETLEPIEERLAAIEKLKKKYGDTIPDILARLEKTRREYEDLLAGGERLVELEADIRKAFESYGQKARVLTEMRAKGAAELERLVEKEIGLLGMKKARFRIRLQSHPFSLDDMDTLRESGAEEAEFLISPNPGEELRPLRRIASGGEISRIMLALKAVGKEQERLKTLIFDEIDSGIGGKTAECIAQRLQSLARRHQVICITHLPQIATFAPHHYRIDKKIEKDRTYTRMAKLEPEERAEEIARLISGSQMTPAAIQTAREMLRANLAPGVPVKKRDER